jgi:general stress protein 26
MRRDGEAAETPLRETDARGAITRLKTKIGGLAVAMVTTADNLCMPTSRPLTTQQFDDDGVLWFFVPSRGTLARDVEHNPRVNVNYTDPGHGVYVAISGYARLVYDPDRIFALWDDRLETWFAEGKRDPGLALLRVDVEQARYWDESSRGIIRLLAFGHAALRHEPRPRAAEHRRLTLRQGNGESALPA